MTAVDIYLKTNFSKNCLEKMTPYNNISANSFKAMKLVTVTSENSCGKCSITFSNKMKRKNKNRIRPSSEQTENGYGSVTIDFNTVD